jgi:hypothetical protein
MKGSAGEYGLCQSGWIERLEGAALIDQRLSA